MIGRVRRLAGSALVLVLAAASAPGSEEPPTAFAPTSAYRARTIEGWPILVNERLLASRPELAEKTLKLLGFQLYQTARRLPPEAVAKLRAVRVWVEENEPHHPCMAYHPDAGWLRDHGMNPDKARCVEIANAENFLKWTFDQPWMVLHELAHAYHHQALAGGFGNPAVKAAFERARSSGRYDAVLRIGGAREKAYALENPREFFAESTEAFFGTNDFYPFVRAELRAHDPATFESLGKLWGSG